MKYPLPFNEKELKQKSVQMRRDIVEEVFTAGSGHPGGSLSATDLFVVLYNSILRHNSEDPHWQDRDRFILSKAHISPAYYSILARTGYIDPSLLTTFRKIGSMLQGHPKTDVSHGIEVGGGSLGQNLSVAVGMALGLKHLNTTNPDKYPTLPRVFDMSSEGELQEGSMWEAIMSAAQYRLSNLCLMIDYNRLQIDGATEDVMEVHPLDKKFKAFNWNVITVKKGHSLKALYKAFRKFEKFALKTKKPTVIIAHTVKGKGISFMENNAGWHGRAPTAEERDKAMKELDETAAAI